MDAVWVIVAILGLCGIIVVAIGAYKGRGEKASLWKWLLGGAGALSAIVVAIIGLSRRKGARASEVEPHKRKVAPEDGEKALLDDDSERTAKGADELRSEGSELDDRAEALDKKSKDLEDRADETDEKMARPRDAGDSSSPREPDLKLVERLRK